MAINGEVYVNVLEKKCLGKDGESCDRSPSFGLVGTKNAIYCSKCRPETNINDKYNNIQYVDVSHKKCIICKITVSSFGTLSNPTIRVYCADCTPKLANGSRDPQYNYTACKPCIGKSYCFVDRSINQH